MRLCHLGMCDGMVAVVCGVPDPTLMAMVMVMVTLMELFASIPIPIFFLFLVNLILRSILRQHIPR